MKEEPTYLLFTQGTTSFLFVCPPPSTPSQVLFFQALSLYHFKQRNRQGLKSLDLLHILRYPLITNINLSPSPRVASGWSMHMEEVRTQLGLPGGSDSKESASSSVDTGSIPRSRRSPGKGNGSPLQCSCLGNSTDGGARWATVQGVAKNRT